MRLLFKIFQKKSRRRNRNMYYKIDSVTSELFAELR